MGFSWNPADWSVDGKKPFSSGGSFLNTFTPAGQLGFNFNDPFGTKGAASAAQAAAEAQMQMAREMRDAVIKQGTENQRRAMALAQKTPEELAMITRSQQAAETQLANQQRLMDSIDPALMEASKQALGILRGDTAAINHPMMDQRNSQRQQLVNSLRSRYGPSGEESSIGQRALRQFDMESNSMFQQNQQGSLAQLMGIAGDNSFNQGMGMAQGNLLNAFAGYGQLQNRELNAQLNSGNAMLGALSGTSQQMIQTAGGQFTGQAVAAAGQNQLANTIISGGIRLASGGGGTGGGTST